MIAGGFLRREAVLRSFRVAGRGRGHRPYGLKPRLSRLVAESAGA